MGGGEEVSLPTKNMVGGKQKKKSVHFDKAESASEDARVKEVATDPERERKGGTKGKTEDDFSTKKRTGNQVPKN